MTAARRRVTALLALVVCALALLGPAAVRSAGLDDHLGGHGARLVTVASVDQHTSTVRLDPSGLPAVTPDSAPAAVARRALTTSSLIISSITVDTPRTRGPPVDAAL